MKHLGCMIAPGRKSQTVGAGDVSVPRRGTRRAVFGCVAIAAASPAASSAAPATLPLRYATTCPALGNPRAITIAQTPKGPMVTFVRADLGALETRDDNLAFVSRRFFFKLRTETELIEFQGHAWNDRLEGLLSDSRGARQISLPAAEVADPTCGAKP